MEQFKKTLEQNKALNQFDWFTFESIVEKVIVGGYDEDGNKDPAQLLFVNKMDLKNHLDGKKFKPLKENAEARHTPNKLLSYSSPVIYGFWEYCR